MNKKIAMFLAVYLFSLGLGARETGNPVSFEDFLGRVNYSEDAQAYVFFTDRLMLDDNKFRESCFARLMKNPRGDFFFTLNSDGTYTDMAWFPPEKKAGCMKSFLATRKISGQVSLPSNPVHVRIKLMEPIVSSILQTGK